MPVSMINANENSVRTLGSSERGGNVVRVVERFNEAEKVNMPLGEAFNRADNPLGIGVTHLLSGTDSTRRNVHSDVVTNPASFPEASQEMTRTAAKIHQCVLRFQLWSQKFYQVLGRAAKICRRLPVLEVPDQSFHERGSKVACWHLAVIIVLFLPACAIAAAATNGKRCPVKVVR